MKHDTINSAVLVLVVGGCKSESSDAKKEPAPSTKPN